MAEADDDSLVGRIEDAVVGRIEDAALTGLDKAAAVTGSSLIGDVAGAARLVLGRAIRKQFSSTAISAISWDPATSDLTVTFARDGREYIYPNVPESVVNGFGQAGSIGEYFHRFIKGVYD